MKTVKKGFTLIELLIVITIIGILAVAFLPSILNAPAKARDVGRIGHLTQLSTAVEAYVLDGGAYKDLSSGCVNATDMAKIAPFVQGGVIPKDPSGQIIKGADGKDCGAGEYVFVKMPDVFAPVQNYVFVAKMEDTNNGNMAAVPNPNAKATKDDMLKAGSEGQYMVLIK